jgi:hypothetical protein
MSHTARTARPVKTFSILEAYRGDARGCHRKLVEDRGDEIRSYLAGDQEFKSPDLLTS